MHYVNTELGFSFDLPDGWREDESNTPLTFYGPKGGLGIVRELIQIAFGVIHPQYVSPESRERYLAEPGAQTVRTRVGDEDNAVELRKPGESEISVVRNGFQYTICHTHDAVTEAAMQCLKRTARFAPRSEPSSFPSVSTAVLTCETCDRQMEVVDATGRGGVTLTRQEMAAGIGGAEQCWECGRVYCDKCYPSRPMNTCVCGRGRDAVRHIDGVTYRGSLRLAKVRYLY